MNTDPQPAYMIGIDLGKLRDYTAVAVMKQQAHVTGYSVGQEVGFDLESGTLTRAVPQTAYTYDLIHLTRWRERPYRDVIPEVEKIIRDVRQAAYEEYVRMTGDGSVHGGEPVISLVLDRTGVGEGVAETLAEAGLNFASVVIHGGDTTSRDGMMWRVPKRELVTTVELLFQDRRLRIPKSHPMAEILVSELRNFRAKTNLVTGHESFGAGEEWRERSHDDTVLATSLACWFGETVDPVRQQAQFEALLNAWTW
jgi:hypothetical protein